MSSLIAEPRVAVGAPRRRWNEISTGRRRLIVLAAMIDLTGRIAMLADLRHRTPDQIRGPRWVWAAASLVSSAGVLPAAYFTMGVRRSPSPQGAAGGHPEQVGEGSDDRDTAEGADELGRGLDFEAHGSGH